MTASELSRLAQMALIWSVRAVNRSWSSGENEPLNWRAAMEAGVEVSEGGPEAPSSCPSSSKGMPRVPEAFSISGKGASSEVRMCGGGDTDIRFAGLCMEEATDFNSSSGRDGRAVRMCSGELRTQSSCSTRKCSGLGKAAVERVERGW
jgi:hypothetical protein